MENNNQEKQSGQTTETDSQQQSSTTAAIVSEAVVASTASSEMNVNEDTLNKINLTIKTPKDKENVLVKPDSTIKEVNKLLLLINKKRLTSINKIFILLISCKA